MQSKFGGHPRRKSVRYDHLVKIVVVRAVNAKRLERRKDPSRLPRIPVLSMRPFEEYFENACVRRQVMTLATHQEEVGYFVCATKRTRDDMAPLERDVVPTAQNLVPTGA